MTEGVLIRPLRASDAERYQDLRLTALRESPSSFGSSLEEESGRSTEQIVAFLEGSAERLVFGAFMDGELLGLCGLGREPARKSRHIGFIRSFYVAVAARGRGLGRALMRRALQEAATWPGLEQLTLAVTGSNAPAIALYEDLGFQHCGRAPRALCVDGVYYDEIQMFLPLR